MGTRNNTFGFERFVHIAFEQGPDVAFKKIEKDFVVYAARSFENQVSQLMGSNKQKRIDPKPQPKPAAKSRATKFKNREPDIVEAEIVEGCPQGAIAI